MMEAKELILKYVKSGAKARSRTHRLRAAAHTSQREEDEEEEKEEDKRRKRSTVHISSFTGLWWRQPCILRSAIAL